MNFYRFFKRACDCTLSSFLLLVLSPLLILTFLLKYVEDFENPLYTSKRVGLNGVVFILYKVRSMAIGNHEQKHPTASKSSPITRLGKLLRRSKLDELPQLINIINGSMSFVGRRPDIIEIVNSDLYDETTKYIFKMKPGVTDIACLYFADLTKLASNYEDPHNFYKLNVWPIKKKLIRMHFENQSFISEFSILLATPFAILFPSITRQFISHKLNLKC